MRAHISRYPNERPGEPLIDLEHRELLKKAKKRGIKTRTAKKKSRRP